MNPKPLNREELHDKVNEELYAVFNAEDDVVADATDNVISWIEANTRLTCEAELEKCMRTAKSIVEGKDKEIAELKANINSMTMNNDTKEAYEKRIATLRELVRGAKSIVNECGVRYGARERKEKWLAKAEKALEGK